MNNSILCLIIFLRDPMYNTKSNAKLFLQMLSSERKISSHEIVKGYQLLTEIEWCIFNKLIIACLIIVSKRKQTNAEPERGNR